jgi:hypothetical protein
LGFHQAHDGFQQGCLPRSVPSNEKSHLPLFDPEGNIVQDFGMTVGNV